ncbi:hypothetical protein KCP78_18570 [Salmonella enterica subsp. enterica]|nr:hypothetical protein KCP78_18570 [Salmonella enterica subsp. enterica]
MDSHGFGMASVRFICGTGDRKALGKLAATRHGRCILYSSCFVLTAACLRRWRAGAGNAIISDALNHASIVSGVRLCKKRSAIAMPAQRYMARGWKRG